MNRNPRVAVVGATGAVGIELIKTLGKRNFPVSKLALLASARSVGRKLKFRNQEIAVDELTKDSFKGIDIALFSAGGGISKEFAPLAAKAGLKRIFASSYQAVSGTGAKAIEELKRQVEELVSGKPATKEVYPHQIAFNVLPQVDSFLPDGYTKEEMKMQNEGRKIMHHPAFRASVTCVRVPVYRAHSVAVSAEFKQPVSVDAAREVLSKAPGLDVVDDPEKKEYPMPLYTAEKYNCQVGRIRKDCALDNGLCFWVSGDQLLKGAALNAVQIAEELLK
ncbi:MAG: aspartate-semialdehyde dehydrogenase [Verrucomicrobia bacterium]|nr:MAG: aspartate-semialdehyde dehydrogenase [Verrucomicrobiota bacterium]